MSLRATTPRTLSETPMELVNFIDVDYLIRDYRGISLPVTGHHWKNAIAKVETYVSIPSQENPYSFPRTSETHSLYPNNDIFRSHSAQLFHNHRAPDAAGLSWLKKNMRIKYQDKKQPAGKASIEIAIKIDELRLVSHHVDGANGRQSTQHLTAIQDTANLNIMQLNIQNTQLAVWPAMVP